MVILEAQQCAKKRAKRHFDLRFGSTIHGDLNRQIVDIFFTEHEPKMAHTARSRGVEDLHRLARFHGQICRRASGAEVRRQLQERHRRIGAGHGERVSRLRLDVGIEKEGSSSGDGCEDQLQWVKFSFHV